MTRCTKVEGKKIFVCDGNHNGEGCKYTEYNKHEAAELIRKLYATVDLVLSANHRIKTEVTRALNELQEP